MEPLSQIGHRPLWTVAFAAFLFSTSVFAAPAARVEFTVGSVTAQTADGRVRTLMKGAAVEVGETVSTNDGRAQLRFTDDGFISLQNNSVFRIDEYRWSGVTDGTESAFFRLLKGGLRTVTGKLAKINKKAYLMSSAVATIGVRGTEYTMQLNGDLVGGVTEGEIEVCNAGGCLAVPAGQAYSVTDFSVKPILSSKQTYLAPPQPADERTRLPGTANAATQPVRSVGLQAGRSSGSLLDRSAGGLVNGLEVTTGSLFGTVDTTTTGLIAFTQGALDSLISTTALGQPVQNVAGTVGGVVNATTSTLNATTSGLLNTTGSATAGVVGTVTGTTGSLITGLTTGTPVAGGTTGLLGTLKLR